MLSASAAVASIPASATQSSSLFHKRRRLNKNKNSFSCRAVAGNNLGHFVQVVKKDVDLFFKRRHVTAKVGPKVEGVKVNSPYPGDIQKLLLTLFHLLSSELSGTDLIMADIKAMEAYILYYYYLSKMWAKPLPEVYDAKEADDYFKCRPHVVALRLIEVFSAFASAAVRIRIEGIKRSKNSTLGTEADEYNSQYNFGMVLKETMLNLGPTFIKVGQSLSTRPDIIGFPITKALSELHDQIPPFPRALAMKIIEEELGSPAETFFSHISEEAVAAASFGQVYRANTVDGRDVAVKVQRPNLRHVVFRDIYIMRVGLDILQQVTKRKSDLRLYADELGKGLVGELDYTLEAANAVEFMEAHSPFPSIRVPKVFQHLTQKRVLTMEWMAGENPKELLAKCNTSFENESQYSEKQRIDAKRHLLDLVNKGAEACLVQLIETGLLHADPHPGNMLYLPSGQIGFLDFGLICRMEKKHKYAMLGSIIHIVNGDWASLVGSLSDMDVVRPGTNISLVTMELENAMDEVEFKDGIPDIRFNRVLGKVWAIAYKYNFRMPPYYTLLLRSLASFEGLAMAGDPNFNTFEDSYPYVVRKLLSDNSLDTRKILHSVMLNKRKELHKGLHMVSKIGTSAEDPSNKVADTVNLALKLLLSKDGVVVRRLLMTAYAREQLLRKFRKKCWNLMAKDKVMELIEKFIDLGGIGELIKGIEMMIEIILRNRRIPYGYNFYLNEVKKMRSLLSNRTKTNTLIESVKIKSVYQSASPIAQDISFQPRNKTRSFRSIFSQIVKDIQLVMKKGVEGIRICCSGRSEGAEIARTECKKYGKTSSNVFNQKIDYAPTEVSTRYGISDLPITGKPTEVRMGRGKGNPAGWIARVSTGQIPFEMDGVSLSNARQAATLAAHKLCASTKFVQWS
ncbi:kinase superfamily protein isoform 1 [Tanacetum coccineum]